MDRHGVSTTAISIETLSRVAKGASRGFVGATRLRHCFTTAWLWVVKLKFIDSNYFPWLT